MAGSQNFRSAFNGFNREDVVHYLEYLNSRHTALVNQLSEEADNLRQKLTVAAEAISADSSRAEQITALEAEREELRLRLQEALAANEASEAARQVLEAECASLRAQLAEAQAAPCAPVSCETDGECEALRQQLAQARENEARLEEALKQAQAAPAAVVPTAVSATEKELEAYRRAERMERLARERADQLYRQTNGVLADAAVKVDQVAADIGGIADQVIAQLQQLQQAVTGSKQALRDAAAVMYTIRPEGEEN